MVSTAHPVIEGLVLLKSPDWEYIDSLLEIAERKPNPLYANIPRPDTRTIEQYSYRVREDMNFDPKCHRDFLNQRHWGLIMHLIAFEASELTGNNGFEDGLNEIIAGTVPLVEKDLLQRRRVAAYANMEQAACYTVLDLIESIRTSGGPGSTSPRIFINNDEVQRDDIIEWGDGCWRYNECVAMRGKYEDKGRISENSIPDILGLWYLTPEDIPSNMNVIETSPDGLDELLVKLAISNPRIQELLEKKQQQLRLTTDKCYNKVSVAHFKQLGYESDIDLAKALQGEYRLHFGVMPLVVSYEIRNMRFFRRVESERDLGQLKDQYKDLKIIAR